jgi:4-amino-4-deoxy-L-arabinose transferase-like glycosyltransferase
VAALAAAPLLLLGLGGAPFDDPGEGMHAQIARELAVSGDPLRLTLAGVPYVDKPPLLYVLVAGAVALGGAREAAARTVPALAAVLAVAAVAWLGARLLGARAGVLAGLALLASCGFFAYGRYLRPDALFVAALAVGFALALVGLAERRPALTMLGLAAFGLAGLAKDPLGALVPPLVIAFAVAVSGDVRVPRGWQPWAGGLALGALGIGWYAAAALARPGFAWYTLVDNHVLNIARMRAFPDEDVPLGAAAFLAVALIGAVPWTLTAGAMIWRLARRRAWADAAERPWVALSLWVIAVLGFTVLSPFRLPHYGLPAYPAVALLAARGWRDLPWRPLACAHALVLGALGLVCGVAWMAGGARVIETVVVATDVATRKSALAGTAAPVPAAVAFAPLLGAVALTLGLGALTLAALAVSPARDVERRRWAAALVVVATLLATLPSVASGLALVASHRAVKAIALEVARRAAPDDVVTHEGPIENSGALEWYGGRRPVIVDGRRSVLGFAATLPGTATTFWDAARLDVAWRSGQRVWLVTARPPELSLAAGLPGARLVATGGGRRLYVNR